MKRFTEFRKDLHEAKDLTKQALKDIKSAISWKEHQMSQEDPDDSNYKNIVKGKKAAIKELQKLFSLVKSGKIKEASKIYVRMDTTDREELDEIVFELLG